MQKFVLLGSIAVLACSAAAQNQLGVFRNTGVTFTTRGGVAAANSNPAVMWNRIDDDKYGGWGADDTMPGMRVITGLHFFIQDQDLATQDTFSLVVYGESTALPNHPELTTALGTTGNFVLPLGTGVGAYNSTANFATPIQAPAANDVYVGISTNAGWNATTTDGLSIWAISGAAGTTATRDLPGFAMPTTPPDLTTFGGYYVPSTMASGYSGQRQFQIEPITTSATGVCSALETGNTLHVAAQTSPGSSCMFSGLYPDAQNPPRNAGRADDVGMTFVKSGLPDGTPVFFLADLSAVFGPELPLSGLLPGSTGNVCINLATASTVALGVTTAGVATNVIVIPLAVRGGIGGAALVQQCAALDPILGVAHAGPCSVQMF